MHPHAQPPLPPAPPSSLPTLASLCHRVLVNNLHLLHDIGDVPFRVLRPVLDKCSAQSLARFELQSPHLALEDDDLWRVHCIRDFTGVTPDLDPTQLIASPAPNDNYDDEESSEQHEAPLKLPPEDSECTTWRAYYEHLVETTETRFAEASERMRASRAEERASKRAKAVQQADPSDSRLMRKTGWGHGGWGNARPQTLFEKAKHQTKRRISMAAVHATTRKHAVPPRAATVSFAPAATIASTSPNVRPVVVRRSLSSSATLPPVRPISSGPVASSSRLPVPGSNSTRGGSTSMSPPPPMGSRSMPHSPTVATASRMYAWSGSRPGAITSGSVSAVVSRSPTVSVRTESDVEMETEMAHATSSRSQSRTRADLPASMAAGGQSSPPPDGSPPPPAKRQKTKDPMSVLFLPKKRPAAAV